MNRKRATANFHPKERGEREGGRERERDGERD